MRFGINRADITEHSAAMTATIVLSAVSVFFAVDCTGKSSQTNVPVVSSTDSSTSLSSPAPANRLPLRTLRDVPLSGVATRFDYQSFDQAAGRLYIAHLGDGSMAVFDVQTETLVGEVKNLVSAESGIVAVFDERGRNLEKVGEGFFAANAHSVAVDSRTHRVYFPLQNVGGKPVLRIALPTDKHL